MKRIGAILSLALIMILLSASVCFAADFKLEESSPKDGEKGMAVDNMGIKLHFNQDISKKGNEDCFAIVDSKGKKVPIRIVYSPDEAGTMMVLADMSKKKTKIKPKTKYTVTVDKSFKSLSGENLGEDIKISFTTLDQGMNMTVSMVMMGVMVVGMIFFSSKSMKKEAEKNTKGKQQQKVNPYKVAKETGKSVEEVVEKEQRKKAKQAAAEEKKKNKQNKKRDDGKKEIAGDNIRVSEPRPISVKAGKILPDRKKKEEQAKKGTTNPKNQSGKAKNSKNKNKGKKKK